MNMKPFFVGLVVCLLLLTGCELNGTVTDTLTGEGIKGVRVSVVTKNSGSSAGDMQTLFSTYTNEDGEYRMGSFLARSKSNNPLAIRFSKPGYAFEPEIIYVKLNEDNQAVVNSEGMPLR